MLPRHANTSPPAVDPAATAEAAEVRLLQRIAAGERCAFERLYRVYYPRLMRFLLRLLRRQPLVEEVLDDTMLVVWHRAASYNGQSKVSTWIFAIAYRKALKALSRLDEAVEWPECAVPEQQPGPEQQLGQKQALGALLQAMLQLSLEQRAVLELTYFHGMDYQQIAAIVAAPVATVKTRMFHARRRLRELLPGRQEDWL